MNISIVLATSVAVATTALTHTATAHADPMVVAYEFGDQSKNIWCALRLYTDGENTAQCDIDKHTFAGPASDAGGSCPQTAGYAFMIRQAGPPEVSCFRSGEVLPVVYNVLPSGQSRTAGAITCNSEASGMTCTNASTGHFFRLSQDSYQVG